MDLVKVVDLYGSGLYRFTDLFRCRVCRAKTRSDRTEKRLRNQFKNLWPYSSHFSIPHWQRNNLFISSNDRGGH